MAYCDALVYTLPAQKKGYTFNSQFPERKQCQADRIHHGFAGFPCDTFVRNAISFDSEYQIRWRLLQVMHVHRSWTCLLSGHVQLLWLLYGMIHPAQRQASVRHRASLRNGHILRSLTSIEFQGCETLSLQWAPALVRIKGTWTVMRETRCCSQCSCELLLLLCRMIHCGHFLRLSGNTGAWAG